MPQENGTLTTQEKEIIINWLREKKAKPECPVCGHNNWVIGDHLLTGMTFTPNAVTLGGPSYPMVFMTCNNCAYTRQFMAIPIGLLTAEENKPDD